MSDLNKLSLLLLRFCMGLLDDEVGSGPSSFGAASAFEGLPIDLKKTEVLDPRFDVDLLPVVGGSGGPTPSS